MKINQPTNTGRRVCGERRTLGRAEVVRFGWRVGEIEEDPLHLLAVILTSLRGAGGRGRRLTVIRLLLQVSPNVNTTHDTHDTRMIEGE